MINPEQCPLVGKGPAGPYVSFGYNQYGFIVDRDGKAPPRAKSRFGLGVQGQGQAAGVLTGALAWERIVP